MPGIDFFHKGAVVFQLDLLRFQERSGKQIQQDQDHHYDSVVIDDRLALLVFVIRIHTQKPPYECILALINIKC